MFSESPKTNSTVFSIPFFLIFCFPISSMPLLMSSPMMVLALVSVRLMAKSPVPVAISRMFSGFLSLTIATTFFRHDMSIPKDITRFNPS